MPWLQAGQERHPTDEFGANAELLAAAGVVKRLGSAGQDVIDVDQYDGRAFDDNEGPGKFAEAIGYPALIRAATEAVHEPTRSSALGIWR